jgi:Mg2+-importing ATPase
MLPMIVTVNLSKGALMMSRKKVIVKRLTLIQNFGAMDILCTDKTGHAHPGPVVLERYVDVTNRESEDVLRYAYMNSYYQTGLRNLLDRAILSHDGPRRRTDCRKVDEIPFDFQRKRMSVIIDYEGDHVLICKGAVEEVYNSCDRYQVDDEINPLIDIIKNDLMEEYERLSRTATACWPSPTGIPKDKRFSACRRAATWCCSATSPSSTRPRIPRPRPRSAARWACR